MSKAKTETEVLMEKILTIADAMKKKIGWTSILVHVDGEDNIVGVSLGVDQDWDSRVDRTFEAVATGETPTSSDKH